jgi:hypothetical protein
MMEEKSVVQMVARKAERMADTLADARAAKSVDLTGLK